MFIVALKFAANRAEAGQHMEGHRTWLRQGFADGVFLLAGRLQPTGEDGGGGGILAHNVSLEALQSRVNEDPFVAAGVVSAEITEMTPSLADDRLNFLIEA